MEVETFEQLVAVLFTTNGLRIRYRARGQGLRNEVDHYLHASPPSLSEFRIICELLTPDRDLVEAAMENVMFAQLTALGAPYGELIEGWCMEIGL